MTETPDLPCPKSGRAILSRFPVGWGVAGVTLFEDGGRAARPLFSVSPDEADALAAELINAAKQVRLITEDVVTG